MIRIPPYPIRRAALAVLVLALSPVSRLEAQDLRAPARSFVEVGTQLHRFSEGIDPWNGLYIRTQIASGDRNFWLGEVLAEDRFGEQAFSYKLGYALDRPAWFAGASVRTSTSGIFNPKWRLDARVGAKTLENRSLLLSASVFHQEVRDGHKDTGLTAEAGWYATPWLIAQGGIRWTHSSPGDVWSRYYDAALTIGRFGRRYVILHAAHGSEAYQIIGQNVALDVLLDFNSTMAEVGWREWLSSKVGLHVSGIYYTNEYYRRGGIEAGVFVHFDRP